MFSFMKKKKHETDDQRKLVSDHGGEAGSKKRSSTSLKPRLQPIKEHSICEDSVPLIMGDMNTDGIQTVCVSSNEDIFDNWEGDGEEDEMTSDESDHGSSSGYGTLPKKAENPIPFMFKSYSVPNLHSKGQLVEYAENPGSNPIQITNVYNSREFIISPNGVSTINKSRTSGGRTDKILGHLGGITLKIETEVFKAGQAALKSPCRNPLVIFKGPGGSGCHFVAKLLYHELLKASPETIGYCLRDPSELCYIETDKKAIILVLGASGRNDFNKNLLNSWYETVEEYMPIGSNRNDNVTIILALREYEEMKGHRFLEEYKQHVIGAGEQNLRPSDETLRKLTVAIANQHNVRIIRTKVPMPGTSTDDESPRIVEKEVMDTIPSLVGRKGHIRKLNDFFRNHLSDGIEFFRRPDPYIVRQMRQYVRDIPAFFLVLLAVHAHKGTLRVGRLEEMKQMNHYMGNFWQSLQNISSVKKSELNKVENRLLSEFPEGVMMLQFARRHGMMANLAKTLEVSAELLEGEYLNKNKGVYQFSSGNVFYSFLVVLCETYPKAIETCDGEFFFKYVKPKDDAMNPDECLLVDTWKSTEISKHLMVRFKEEFMLKQVAKSMTHPVMLPHFFETFLQFLGKTRHLTWQVLQQQDNDSTNPYTCLFYGLQDQCSRVGDNRNNTDVIICHGKWAKRRNEPKWKEWASLHEQETILLAVELQAWSTFKRMVKMGVKIPIASLEKAITYQIEDVLDIILEKGIFTETEWYNEVIHALSVLCTGVDHDRFDQQTKAMMSKVDIQQGVENLPPLLFHAVRTNNQKMIQILFTKDFLSANAINQVYEGDTAVHEASRLGFTSIVAELLHRRGNKGQIDSPMVLYDQASLESLMHDQPCIIHDKDLLFSAVTHGKLETAEYIIKAYDEIMTVDPDETHRKYTLSDETSSARVKCTSCSCWFPLDPLRLRNNDGQSALHIASENGHAELVDFFIQKGLDVAKEDKYGETALSLACRAKQTDVLKVIVIEWNRKGYKTDEKVVLRAVQDNDMLVLNVLIQNGFEINFVSLEYGSPLIVVTKLKLIDMMNFLLTSGADPNIMHNGWAPIHVTALNGDVVGFETLKNFGADVLNTQGTSKQTIIHIAVEKLNTEYIDYIFRTGSDDCNIMTLINQKNTQLETALHIAARLGSVDLVRLLLMHGFNAKIQNRSGFLPVKLVNDGFEHAVQKKNMTEWNAFADCRKLLY